MKSKLLFFYSSFSKMPLIKYVVVFLSLSVTSAIAQSTGDYRSKATGNWGDFTTWQIYNGTSWQNAVAGEVPGGTNESDANNVYLEAGYTVTLTNDAACKNINLSTVQDVVRLNTNNFTLNVWGKFRNYSGTAPGTTDGTGAGMNGWIATGTGSIKIRGTVSRTVFFPNEFGASSRTAGWTLDFAFDNGVTGFFKNTMRCGYLIVSSGILDVSGVLDGEVADYEIRVAGSDYTPQPGNGVSGGTCIIKSGATLKSFRLRKNNPTSAGNSLASFTIEENAVFVAKLNSQVPALAYDIRGDVKFLATAAQTFIGTGNNVDASPITNYANVVIAGSAAKTLQANTTISGKLTIQGTSSIALGAFALSYGTTGVLEYNGSAAQTTTNTEFPVNNGPVGLIINNSNGVKLHANRSLNGALSLQAGIFDLQNSSFLLGPNSPAITGTLSSANMILTSGTGELRKTYSSAGSYFFPVGEAVGTTEYTYARIDVNSADVLNGTTYVGLRVIGNSHPADNGVAFGNVARYWAVTSNMANINYDGTFQYLTSDVNGVEDSLNAYLYGDETPLASGLPITRVNSLLHRISLTGQSALGFITAANHCRILNNAITYSGDAEFCTTTSLSAPFNGTVASVNSNTPSYQWQQKINNGGWSDLTSANLKDYTEASSLSGPNTYYYRRNASDAVSCLTSDYNSSNEISVEFLGDIASNQIGSDQIITDGTDADAFTSIGSLSGGDGTYTYQWQSSATAGGPYTDISLADALTYDAGALSSTTYFVRKVSSAMCSSSLSNEISITVTPVLSNQNPEVSEANIYPNPTSGLLYVNFPSLSNNCNVVLTDNQGAKLLEKEMSSVELGTLDMSKYASGLYILHFMIDGKTTSYKISKR